MRRRKIGVIGRAATLALLASGAGANAAEVAICSLVTKPANFDRQAVTFQGTTTAVKKTTSRRGNDYTLFKLKGPRDCGTVDVFTWGHPKLGDGDHIRVEGVFESVHHQDRSVRSYKSHSCAERLVRRMSVQRPFTVRSFKGR
jgi:hypothetical protein